MSVAVIDLRVEIDRLLAALASLETATDNTDVLASLATLNTNISDIETALTPAALTITSVSAGAAITADVNAAIAGLAGQRLYGFSVREDAGGRATFNIMHGATVGGGSIIYTITLNPYESTSDYFPRGLPAANGISIDWVEGSYRLVLMS